MTLFVLKGALRERERLVREAAESGGWKSGSAGDIRGSGGLNLSFKKGRDEAHVQLWPTPETDCHGASIMDCASYVDHAFVQQT